MRTRLSLRKSQKWSLSLKIGFALMTSDILLLLFTPINILYFGTMQYVQNKCIWTATHWNNINVVGAWTVISDFIISLYCLFVFILPLRKLIEFEQEATKCTTTETEQKGQSNIQLMVQRIMIYSTIMLVTTMASYIVFIANFSLGLYAAALDLTLNAYCVVMQFSPVDTEMIDSFFWKWFVRMIQCKLFYNCKSNICWNEAKENEMNMADIIVRNNTNSTCNLSNEV